ncbi:GbsR/MarR family transcriptional regulator [Paenibacillus zeisoli]|nr:transcriptional regulator [Paenibacillus zeisoli]
MEAMREDEPKYKEWIELRNRVIGAISVTMDLYGVTPSAGALYGTMFFEDEPMTLEEMKDKMGMSKSNMSYAARSLLDSRMIEKLDTKRDRKDLYRAQSDFYVTFRNFFSTKLQRERDVMMETIEQVLPDLKELILHPDTPEDIRQNALKDLHKLYHSVEFYSWMQQFIDMLQDGHLFEQTKDIVKREVSSDLDRE